jgi:tRNA-Thr(GGU) m(6)t(6)A37 methyltransferase TsaA
MGPNDGGVLRLRPIGRVVGGRVETVDDRWDPVSSVIELDPGQVDAGATDGLADFSHIEVVFCFDQVSEGTVCRGTRHPRGRTDWPSVGILAQRAKDRPNRIGLTVCSLVRVDAHRIEVRGLDAVDGTPILDVKPYMAEFGPRGELRQPAWSTELMAGYW